MDPQITLEEAIAATREPAKMRKLPLRYLARCNDTINMELRRRLDVAQEKLHTLQSTDAATHKKVTPLLEELFDV